MRRLFSSVLIFAITLIIEGDENVTKNKSDAENEVKAIREERRGYTYHLRKVQDISEGKINSTIYKALCTRSVWLAIGSNHGI